MIENFKKLVGFIIFFLSLNSYMSYCQDHMAGAKAFVLTNDEAVQTSNYTNIGMTDEVVSSGILLGCFKYKNTCWYKVTLPTGFTNLKAVLTPKDATKKLAIVMMSTNAATDIDAGIVPTVYSTTEVCATTPGQVITSTRNDKCLPTKTNGYDVYIAIGSANGTTDVSDFTLQLNAIKPTCSDGCQNQNETSIDAGGECATSTTCGTCTLPDCKITHNTTVTDATLIQSTDYNLADFFVPTVPASGTISTCYTLTSDANGSLGVRISENLSTACTNTEADNVDLTRKYTLVEKNGTCPGTAISPNVTNKANSVTKFNPEWYGLKPNTNYTLCVSVDVNQSASCKMEKIGMVYYHPDVPAPLPCGKLGIDWRNTTSQPKPTNTELTTCADKDFSIKVSTITTAQQYIAPGFDVSGTFGQINLSKIEVDEGATGTYQNTLGQTAMTFCSPSLTYKIRLTGSVNPGGSGVIKIIDHATGEDLYVGAFTSGMIITLPPNTIKGTATYSGPGVSNYKLNAPTTGATTFLASGYGVFNPKKAGNGTHTITYAWNNGNQDCGTATMTVTVSGCATPVCKVVDIDLYDDNQISTPHTGTSFNCNSNIVYLAPKDVVNKYLTTTEDPDFTWPFPMIRTEITATSGNMNNLLINYYDPITGVLIESGNAISVNTHYFARKEGYQITLDKTDNTSGTYTYITYDVMTGAVIASGTITVTNGVESAKTVIMKPTNFNGTFTCTTCGSGALIQGISPYIDELGLGTFDPKKAGVGTHILTYTWDNGLTGANNCKGSKSINVTVTGGPTATGSLADICAGATTSTLTFSNLTGTPTTYSIDWDATANTAGLTDIVDNTIATTTLTIPSNLVAGSYTGSFSVKNASGCSSTAQSITLKVNSLPIINGSTTICEGSTVEWTSTATLISSDINLATIAANGTKFNVTALKPTSSPSNLKITATSSGCSTEKEITINPKAVTTIKCGNPTSNSVTVEWTSVTPATGYNIEVDKGSGYGSAIPVGISSLTYDVTGLSSTDVIKFKITPTGPTGPCYLISNEITCKPSNCPKPTLDNNFPVDVTVCADLNATASFKVVATSTPEPTYKWQKIVGTNPAVDLQNDAVFDGVDKNILNIKNITGLDGVKFQCIATETSGTGCNITSFAKTLKINPLPTFTPTALDICEGEAPVITYPSLTGNPDKIIFDPGIPPIAPLNLTLSASPFKITGLPVPLPVNTYSGFKVKLENSTTGCKSTDITIPAFKVQATQKPSISAKSTSVNSVIFQWSDLTGLNTQTGTTKDSYTVKEFVCSGCSTPGTYVNGTGTLSYNSTTSKWEYLKNGLTSGDKVFIEVTPVDVAPLAIPSCYTSSTFELVAITCISPVITNDIIDISLCEGTIALPVSTTLSLDYNSADATTPATWEILTPGGTWTTLNSTGIYTITGSTNVDSKLSISDIKGLDGTKYRVNLKTATVSGSCNTISHEAILTVKPLPVMTSITDKLFCPGTIVNDPLKTTKDIEFKVSQYGTPTFTWVSDLQTTGVSTGSPNVNDFASFTTLSPSNDVVSKITVTPTLNQCVGQPFSFNITVKPTVKPIFSTTVTDFSSVKFVWTSSSIAPDFWEIDTAVTNVSVPAPPLNLYKAVTPIAGTINNYTVSGINSSKKAYINVKAKKSIGTNDLFCPVADGYSGIPTPCVKPTKPLTPLTNPICEGSALSVTGVLPDALADFQWKISTNGGTTWNNVSATDFGSTGTTNVLTTTTTKTYMNNAQVKLVLTDKLTGQCTEESDKVILVINPLPTVKLIQPVKNSLCVDDNEVSATVQPLLGLSPMKVDYTMNGVTTTNQDITNLDIKFATSSETNHSLSIDKVTDANGCINLLTGLISSVSVHKNPTPAFTVSDTIGCLPLLVNFIDISGETYKDVTWDFGTGINSSKDFGTTTFPYQKEGDYTVTYSVENINGCKADIVIVDMIHVKKPPKAMISNDRNLINIYENVVHFDSKLSQNATFYRWDFGDNSSISNEAIVDHKYDPNSPGKFKVYLIVSNSPTNMTCSDTAITWIDFPEEVIYYIPNTFTPNGDEFNNTFQPIFSSGYDPQNYSFIIFDRWGQIVFESKNPTVGWDGTYGDKVLGNDTFVWKLGFKEKANDNEHYTTGHVNLVK